MGMQAESRRGDGERCSTAGCANKAQASGRCRTHTGIGQCTRDGCGKQAQYKGLCVAHGGRRICTQPGCNKTVTSKGKCGEHGGGRRRAHRAKSDAQEEGNTLLVSARAVMPATMEQAQPGRVSMMSLLMDGWAPDAPGNKDDQAYVPLKSEAPVWTGFQQHHIAYPLQESVSNATPPASNQNSGSMMSLLLDGWPAPNGVAAGQTQTQNTLHDKHAMTNITAVTTPTLSSNARPRNPRKRALCTHEGCTKIAQSQGLCVGHGGKRCLHPGCTKSAQLQGVCISHGGSRTCSYPGCTKMTRSAGRCFEHGGGKQCSREGCVKQAQARGLCSAHGKR